MHVATTTRNILGTFLECQSPPTAPTGKEHLIMTVIPIASLSQAEIHMLGTNIISAARGDGEIDAVNRSLAIHDEQVADLADHRSCELMATG
jgi:hypothetical protein